MTAAMKGKRRIGCSEKQVAMLVLMAAVSPISQGCRVSKLKRHNMCTLYVRPRTGPEKCSFVHFWVCNMHVEICFLRTSSLSLPVILPYFRSSVYRHQHRMHGLKQLHSARSSMSCVQLWLEDFQGMIYETVAKYLLYNPISLCLVLSLSLLNTYVTNKFYIQKGVSVRDRRSRWCQLRYSMSSVATHLQRTWCHAYPIKSH